MIKLRVLSSARHHAQQRGFTYLLLLFVLALGGTGLAALGQRASLHVQRDKEAELRFRGQAIARAIASYWQATPGPVKQYPKAWNDLLEDRRGLVTQRHLRQIYTDPFTGQADWVLIPAPVAVAPAPAPSAAPSPGFDEANKANDSSAFGAKPKRQNRAPQEAGNSDAFTSGPVPPPQPQASLDPNPEPVASVWVSDRAPDNGFSGVRSRSRQRLLNVRDLSAPDPKKPPVAADLKFDARAIALPSALAKDAKAAPAKGSKTSEANPE